MIAITLSLNIKPSTGMSGVPAEPSFLLLSNGDDYLLLAANDGSRLQLN